MPTFRINAGHMSRPRAIALGQVLTVTPDSPATAKVEYTIGTMADIQNGAATWLSWPLGDSPVSAVDIIQREGFIRVTATGGGVTYSIDEVPTSQTEEAFNFDWASTRQLNSPLRVTGGDRVNDVLRAAFVSGSGGLQWARVNPTTGASTDIAGQTGTTYTRAVADIGFIVTAYATSYQPAAAGRVTRAGYPTAPQNVTATAGNGQATIAWSAPANTYGAVVSRYIITNVATGAETYALASETSKTVSGLTNNVQYMFMVQADSAVGPGPAANVTVTPVAIPGSWRNAASKTVQGGSLFTAQKQVMSTTVHQSRISVPITSVRLVDSNWGYAAGQEVLSGAANIITASIEYPVGTTPQRLLYGGIASGSNANGLDLESDDLILATPIPAGATFKVHRYITNTAGLFLPTGLTTADGDACKFGASGVTDVTGTIGGYAGASTDTTHYSPPAAILAFHNGTSLGGVGDSRFAGFSDTQTSTVKYPIGEIGRAVLPYYPYIQFGAVGETPAQFTQALAPRRIAFIGKYCTHVVCEHAINGFTTSAALQTSAGAIWNIFKALGIKVYQTTTPPRTTGAWTLTDGSDQTEDANAAELQAWNTYLRGAIPINGIVDLAPLLTLPGNPRKWNAPNYTNDGLHEMTAANLIIASSGIITGSTFA